jgi:type IV pilus assembly protein PilF
MTPSRGERRWFRASGTALILGACVALTACGHVGHVGQGAAIGANTPNASDSGDKEVRARLRLALASAHFAQSRLETALVEVQQALTLDPLLAEAMGLRALVYAGLQHHALAEDSFNRALVMAPDNANILHNQGWYLCQRGQHAAGQVALDKALIQPLYRDAPKTRLVMAMCRPDAGVDLVSQMRRQPPLAPELRLSPSGALDE